MEEAADVGCVVSGVNVWCVVLINEYTQPTRLGDV
jgi:hypothetical protein